MSRPLSLGLYAAATALAEPLAPAILRRRARRGKEDPERLGERLGEASVPRPPGSLVWLHGVSVGESVSLLPLAEALRIRRPDLALLVTSGTRTSAELLGQRLPAGAIHQYAPVDGPQATARFLDHWRPDLGVFVESELWPNLILGARDRGVKLALVSARMTQKSADGWARTPAAAEALLAAYDLILPQEAQTEARLANLGARIDGHLNLKRVGPPPPVDAAELTKMLAIVGSRPVVLAASTHPGEEFIIAEAIAQALPDDALLVIAPRHPERGPEVAALFANRRRTARRAAGQELNDATQVYVADTLGEMGLFFRMADLVVMGGSFLPDIGGHNPLEPARLGLPVITGPHVFNNASTYAELFAAGAALEAADAGALARQVAELLADPDRAREIGEAGLAYAERQQGALEDAMGRLDPLLPLI